MPTISIDDVRNVRDFAPLYKWNLQFLNVPLNVLNVEQGSPSTILNTRCTSVEVPKMEAGQSIDIQVGGHHIKQPGLYDYNHSLTINFVEDVDNSISKFISSWRETCWTSINGSQAASNEAKCNISLERLDLQNDPIWYYKLVGCFLEDYDPVGGELGGDSSEIVRPSITLSYDYFLEGDALPQSGSSENAVGYGGDDSPVTSGYRLGGCLDLGLVEACGSISIDSSGVSATGSITTS